MNLTGNISYLDVLERITQVYGFTQKLQLANHFGLSPSTLQNRYTRGTVSFDLAAMCSIETGVNLKWLLTGEGPQHDNKPSSSDHKLLPSFTLRDGVLEENSLLSIGSNFFTKEPSDGIVVMADSKMHFVEKSAPLSDGLWLIEIEGANSIRELTLLPGKRLHVAGGKIPFECGVDEIKVAGRVMGIYSEIS